MPVNTMQLIASLKPRLIKNVVLMREDGKSFDDIARLLSRSTDYPVGREVVRRWFISQAEKTAE